MNCARHLLSTVMVSAAIAAAPALSQPAIRDATGNYVAAPAGMVDGALSGYLTIGEKTTTVYFYEEQHSTSMKWWPGSYGGLYYRSSDCSGPALIIDPLNNFQGTLPSAVVIGKHHTWLHLADSTQPLGYVTFGSRSYTDGECSQDGGSSRAWKTSAPAIDLDTMFVSPFSIH